jgi:hypothetical protein
MIGYNRIRRDTGYDMIHMHRMMDTVRYGTIRIFKAGIRQDVTGCGRIRQETGYGRRQDTTG